VISGLLQSLSAALSLGSPRGTLQEAHFARQAFSVGDELSATEKYREPLFESWRR